jgi:DNA-binding NarL/FixJ family response regulator
MNRRIRILAGRTSELWWDGLLKLLEVRHDIEVVAVCNNAPETIRCASELRPDIVLLDEEIQEGDCGEVAQNINVLDQKTEIIVVIKPYKNINLASMFKARAKAYIDKDITFEELITTTHYVAKGGVAVISRIVAQTLLEHLESFGQTTDRVRPEYEVGLSNREMEILGLLAKKVMTNKEIAEVLFITENTVKAHLSSILEKMKVRNRKQAIDLARKAGIVSKDSS